MKKNDDSQVNQILEAVENRVGQIFNLVVKQVAAIIRASPGNQPQVFNAQTMKVD